MEQSRANVDFSILWPSNLWHDRGLNEFYAQGGCRAPRLLPRVFEGFLRCRLFRSNHGFGEAGSVGFSGVSFGCNPKCSTDLLPGKPKKQKPTRQSEPASLVKQSVTARGPSEPRAHAKRLQPAGSRSQHPTDQARESMQNCQPHAESPVSRGPCRPCR